MRHLLEDDPMAIEAMRHVGVPLHRLRHLEAHRAELAHLGRDRARLRAWVRAWVRVGVRVRVRVRVRVGVRVRDRVGDGIRVRVRVRVSGTSRRKLTRRSE